MEYRTTSWGRGLVASAGALAASMVLVQPSWADREDQRWHGHIERFHEGYYPYVPNCPGGWRAVPATPGNAPVTPPPVSPAPPPAPPQ